MPKNQPLIDAANRAAELLGLPALLLKAFMGVEGANVNHRDGVLQVTPGTRTGVISRIARPLKLAALGSNDDPAIGEADLDARFAAAFDAKNLLVQVLCGGQYIKEQLDRFNGYVALAGLAYNAGPGRARSEINDKWGGDPFRAALQYHKPIGAGGDQVTVQPGIPSVDAATGAQWIRFPVTANDTGVEIFQYLYLRRVPKRNFGLLDFIFDPTLLDRVSLLDGDAPPGSDHSHRALVVTNGQFRFAGGQPTVMFNTLPLSQRDPRWKDILLGFTDEGRTLGSDGCTLTCLTMLANGFGFQETPATLNDKLKALGQNQGFFSALIAWYGLPRALQGLKLNKLVDCRKVPAPIAEIDALLDAGKPIVAELDMSPSSGLQNHWVLIYARQGGDYLIHDPWPTPAEGSASLTQRYGFAGSPAQIITYCAFFDNPNFQPAPIDRPDEQQPPETTTVIVVNDTPDIRNAGGLALRNQPSAVGTQVMVRLPAGTTLSLIESVTSAKQKVGVYNQWLNVSTQEGAQGWVAAWYVYAREVAVTKSLPLPSKRRGVRELDVASAVQPPLRTKVFVVAKKSRKRIAIYRRTKKGDVLAYVKGGTRLEALETEDALQRALRALQNTKREGWIRVLVGKKQAGYILSKDIERQLSKPKPPRAPPAIKGMDDLLAALNEPDAQPVLRVKAQVGLRLRDAPSTTASIKTVLPFGTSLLFREPIETAAAKIGQPNYWLNVATLDGVPGYVAAEWVELISALPDDPDIQIQGVVFANSTALLFKGPLAGSGSEWRVTAGTPLRLVDQNDWPKIGDANAFLHVESHAFKRGFVRASLLRAPDFADRRTKVEDAPLPFGICAWNYGLHDPYDRGLFAGSGDTGWVLFTHRVVNGEGFNYEDWSRSGYGVIARLNNDYGGSGTIPVPEQYDAFAEQCRSWALNSRGNLIWVIGNEMNNPREWPGDGNDPNQDITPERYAACFNKVRAAIKSVQPGAIVVPGAIDPYQGPRQSCLEYFERMLAAIADLDGIALHCYTHGYTPDLVTSLDTFQNNPLRWQYYHFRCYATLMDVIPARHRNKPVYITEADPTGAQPWAGGQNGWVQAAYAEVDRYNNQPQAQQIQCALLYRWSRDDVYSIVDKPGVQNDIRHTINSTDYRWRG